MYGGPLISFLQYKPPKKMWLFLTRSLAWKCIFTIFLHGGGGGIYLWKWNVELCWHSVCSISIDMVEAKYLCFPIFCIFTTPWSYINIGFKNIPPLKCLILVKTTRNLHCWIQLSPVFQNARGTGIFDLTFEWRHSWNLTKPGSNPENDTSIQCLYTNISKTSDLK